MKSSFFKKFILLLVIALLIVAAIVFFKGRTESSTVKGRQILINPDFSQPLKNGNPPGWFRAMMPHLTQDHKAGIDKDKKGSYLYLEQKGVKGQLFNNWAQRIKQPTVGARMRLETEVSTKNAGNKGAIVMLMFFDKAGKILGAASSDGEVDLTGTKSWTKVNLDAVVPESCDVAIVRLGLSAGPGSLYVRSAKLYVQDPKSSQSSEKSKGRHAEKTGGKRQILINPDFRQSPVMGNPPGWFRAMMPHLTQGHKAGLAKDNTGPYLYLQQQGVKGQLFNNWAQRIEQPPAGAKVKLEAQVATKNAGNKGAVVMLMFFDKAGKILGAASSEGKVDLTGTKSWTRVNLDAVVPENCDVAIVRLGLSAGPGSLYVRYARLYLEN